MKQFKFIGANSSVVVAGIEFGKDEVKFVNDDDWQTLKASGFWQSMLKNGEMVEVLPEVAKTAEVKDVEPKNKAKDVPKAEK